MGRGGEEFRGQEFGSSGVRESRYVHCNEVESYANRKRQKTEFRRPILKLTPDSCRPHHLQVLRIRGIIFVSDQPTLAVASETPATPELLNSCNS